MHDKHYTFRPVEHSDLSLLSEWIKVPAVAQWFDDPDYIDDLEENLEDHRIHMQLVLLDDKPIAYLQDYNIHAWTDHHLAFLPKGSRGLDTFIGYSNLMGQGHGTHYLKLYSKQLFDNGVPALGIDPSPNNIPARRTYQKIGFTDVDQIESKWGHVVLMELFPTVV